MTTAYLTIPEAAERLDIGERTLRRAIDDGRVPALRLAPSSEVVRRVPAFVVDDDALDPAEVVPELVSANQLARLLRCHPRTITEWAAAGTTPLRQDAPGRGFPWWARRTDVVAWLDAHTTGGDEIRPDQPTHRVGRAPGAVPPARVAWPPETAMPLPWRHQDDIVPPRHFDCAFYDRCLALVVRREWTSWSCSACEHCPRGVLAQPLAELPELQAIDLRAAMAPPPTLPRSIP